MRPADWGHPFGTGREARVGQTGGVSPKPPSVQLRKTDAGNGTWLDVPKTHRGFRPVGLVAGASPPLTGDLRAGYGEGP